MRRVCINGKSIVECSKYEKQEGLGVSFQWVRVLVILAEDLGLVNPSTQMTVQNHS